MKTASEDRWGGPREWAGFGALAGLTSAVSVIVAATFQLGGSSIESFLRLPLALAAMAIVGSCLGVIAFALTTPLRSWARARRPVRSPGSGADAAISA